MKFRKLIITTVGLFMTQLATAEVMGSDAWIREAPPGAKALAGYMQLHNQGKDERVLVAAESPAFDEVMLHKTVMQGNMATMQHQQKIVIKAGEQLTFEPNSYHLMLMKPKQPLRVGDKVPVSLEFNNGETIVIDHEVRSMDGDGNQHQHHHH